MSTLHIAPHLQRALDTMSKDLAIDPQALVNQALFAWLRINGYVLPGAAAQVTTNPELAAVPPAASDASLPIPPHVSRASPVPLGSIPAPATGSMPAQRQPEPAPAPVAAPAPAPAPAAVAPPAPAAVVAPVAPVVSPSPVPGPAPVAPVVSPSPVPARAPVVPGPVAVDSGAGHVARMKEIAADLEKLTCPWPDWVADAPIEAPDEDEDEAEAAEDEASADEETPEPAAREEEDELPDDEGAPSDEADEAPAAAAGPIPSAPGDDPFEATSIRSSVQEERLDENTGENDVEAPREELDEGPPPESTVVLRSVPIVLYLERDGEDPIRIETERFIIGRGPTCDLIIDSPRVSREHVVLTREGVRYFIEDLNSSNGTWLGEERLTKREIESGDLISLGNEPVTFILRGE